ncbi:uncharacterized protein FOMMEDRAFT_84824, partial [Fomitiporia mediterranea MF3/22]|uniref:uncharacterized protein n=1 Tax=Fomitiporia mediterranea (strain MF3/22) TaxID=694068 RepID=UPI0004407F2B
RCLVPAGSSYSGCRHCCKILVYPWRYACCGITPCELHTVLSDVSGKVGSVMYCLIPVLRRTGVVAALTSKRLFQLADARDSYIQTNGTISTMGNLTSTFAAVGLVL